jgi:hypothetical protein
MFEEVVAAVDNLKNFDCSFNFKFSTAEKNLHVTMVRVTAEAASKELNPVP